MSILSRVRERFESRAVDASDFGRNTDSALLGVSDAGVTVSRDTAQRLIAVLACQGLLADSVSTMPVDVFRDTANGKEPVARPAAWVTTPNDDQTWQAFIEQVMMDLLNSGNAFVSITRDAYAMPFMLQVVPAQNLVVTRENGVKTIFDLMSGRQLRPYTSRRLDGDVLHLSGLSDNGLYGLSPIEKAQQAIGLGLATEKFGAKFFGNGSQLAGTVEMPPGSIATEEQIQQLSAMWRRKFSGVDKAWSVPVLQNGAKFNPMQMPNEQAQFIESRKFSVEEIARLYRVPPHMIGDVERSTSWGSGIEEQGIGFVKYTLNPWIIRLEMGLSQLLARGQYLKWNVNSLQRGDIQSRYAAYQTGVAGGWINRNEVREWEDLSPVDGLNDFLIPVNQAQPQETVV